VRVGVRQHARPESISKRAQSTTLTSLRLESAICGRSGSDYRKTLLQILLFCDAICIQRFTDGADSIVMEIVSDLLMSFDHLRRSRTRESVFTDEAMEPVVPLRGMAL
jgi:hypothetical protein